MYKIFILKAIIIVLMLIYASYRDLKEKIIPDKITYPGIILGIIFILVELSITKEINKMYVLGGIIGLIIPLFLAVVSDGKLGGGDIKALTMIGLNFGIGAVAICFITIPFTARIVIIIRHIKAKRRKENRIDTMVALGPHITLGVLVFLLGQGVI